MINRAAPVLIKTCSCGVIFLVVAWLILKLTPLPFAMVETQGIEQHSLALLDHNSQLLNISLAADQSYRVPLKLNEIAPAMQQATLLYEDKDFYKHYGVNFASLLRATYQSVLSPSHPVGASTLSMQLVRLKLAINTRSISGKLKQIFWALVLERHFRKQQILEAYFNAAPYGSNVQGVGAAALVYFRKQAKDLTLPEAITLSLIPQNPSLRWKKEGRSKLVIAQDLLSHKWQATYAGDLVRARDFTSGPAEVPAMAPHLLHRISATNKSSVITSIDHASQSFAQEILSNALKRYADYGIQNGTVLVAELPTMAVRAYVGSENYTRRDINGFVNGLVAQRSPGSLLKPFVYALALDQGKILPESMLSDLPIRFASYHPENFERNFLGPISAREALVRSRNIPALQVLRSLDAGSFYELLRGAGVKDLRSEEYYGLAIVLGGLGITAEEIAEIYGMLGNYGKLERLKFLENEPMTNKAPAVRLLSNEASYLTLEMLASNPPALAGFSSQHIPWKTGTSFGSKDAWAAGIVGQYVVVVWLGNFDGTPNPNLIGRDFAGPVFFSLAERLLEMGAHKLTFPQSGLNLKKVEVCALSGAIAGPYCPHRKLSWFIPAKSPISQCTIHQQIEIDKNTNERVCPGEHGESRIYEVWNSEMQELFKRAGLSRSAPPVFAKRCQLQTAGAGSLRIITPEEHLEYFVERERELNLELLASAPGDAAKVTWFVDDQPLSESKPDQPVYWPAKVGNFSVRAVDDLGRSAVVNVKVTARAG